jgi:hypothetical protein
MQECKLLLCPVAFALEINGIKFGIATSTRIPMITRTTSNSVNEKALNAFPLKVFRFRTFIIHTLYS